MNREPSAVLSALGAFLASIVKVLVLLNILVIDAQQLAGISLVIDTFIIMLGALFIRSQVTPVRSPALPEGTSVTVLDVATGKPTGDHTQV